MLDYIRWKNPVTMWLSRHGYWDNSNPAVPFAVSHMQQRIRAEQEGKPQREQKDLLAKFMEAHKQRPEVVTQKEVLAMCLTMIFAGSETT
jgi:cytochrome P450